LGVALLGLPAFSGTSCPDFWWHLLLTRDMVSQRSLHLQDTLSFAPEGASYLLTQWLGEVLVIGLPHHLLGPLGTSLVAGACGLLVVALSWRTAHLYLRAPGPAFALALGLCVPFLSLYARPQVLSFVLMAALVLLLERARSRDWPLRHAAGVALVMALWVNIHGSYVVGIMLLGLHLVCPAVGRWFSGDSHVSARHIALRVAPFLLIGLAATLLNPWGWDSWVRVVEISQYQSTTSGVIAEWRPTNFGSALGSTYLLAVVCVLLLMAISRERPSVEEVTWTACVVVFGLLASRQAFFSLLMLVPVAARAARSAPGMEQIEVVFRARVPVSWGALALAAAAGLHVCLHTSQAEAVQRYEKKVFPVEAAAFMRDTGLRGKVYNDVTAGGWIAYHLGLPVFVDGRLDLHGDKKFFEWFFARNGVPGWAEAVRASGADIVLIQTQAALAQLVVQSGEFALVHSDAAYSVAVKREPRHAAYISRYEQASFVQPAIFGSSGRLALPPLGY
jgi:hypothetical protein